MLATDAPCPSVTGFIPPAGIDADTLRSEVRKQYGIRLSDEVMELVSRIQEFRLRSQQSPTLAAVVEDAIKAYYDLLVERGHINDKD